MIISIATLDSDLSSKQLQLVAKWVMHCESIVILLCDGFILLHDLHTTRKIIKFKSPRVILQ